MSGPDASLGEWVQPDPAEVARYDALMEAYADQETARQQERAAAEERRQTMLARDGAQTTDATSEWLAARSAHQDARLRYVALAEQQRGERDADREAGG